MRAYKNSTMDEAVGAADKEWRQMARLAIVIRERNNNPKWEEEKRKLFKGIYKRLLEDPIDEVKREAR